LDFLGFPWILSSESRLIKGLRWIFAEKFFLAAFSPGSSHRGHASLLNQGVKAQDCSSGKLNSISNFLQ